MKIKIEEDMKFKFIISTEVEHQNTRKKERKTKSNVTKKISESVEYEQILTDYQNISKPSCAKMWTKNRQKAGQNVANFCKC